MHLHKEVPNVVKLALHFPEMHQVVYDLNDEFNLQLLLTVICVSQSFKHLRTVNSIECPMFKSICIALGLLKDDDKWSQCLEEVSIITIAYN
ncbi:17216_t:CDS:2 [Cetraspora pellucida]|uniref:17216_t:CDS:1 n=1 Tax=Cetraspora pellucida TaxID=1433469 RepID=A0A9N9DUY2_9GLOM|nr:17216_t:CDS:2 [Cetraspora pellucida]